MNDKGQWAEKIAGEYLEKSGYSPLLCNFSWKYGEIDLIMKDKDNIHPSETITKNKVKKIKKTAEFFLHKNKLHEAFCRFDFISLQGTPEDYIIEHIKDAF